MKQIHLLIIFLSAFQFTYAQTSEEEKEEAGYHRISVVIGHAYIPQGIEGTTKKQWLFLGSWGIDYDYWFHSKWAIGLHSDWTVQNYAVERTGEDGTEGVLERTRPFASTVAGIFKPGEHFSILVGFGGEFSKEENLFLIRGGLEYGWELPDDWEIGISLMNDFKIDTYNSWIFGLGVSKVLGRKL